MKFWSDSDKWPKKPAKNDQDSPKKIELTDLDPVDINEELTGGPLVKPADGKVRIFGKYSDKEIRELLEWSGVLKVIEDKGYSDYYLDLQYLSDLDQRIYVKSKEEILIHLRLKLSHFRFRLHPGAPQKKLLYIDWLMTRHPATKNFREDRLFPGQDVPGLGIFNQIRDFIANLSMGVGARGAFNIPEYFHDAVLFHREFSFYDPARESFFRALLRDLRRYGAREISNAFAEDRVFNAQDEQVTWTPGEMISALSPELEEILWTPDYHTKVVRGLKRFKFRIEEKSPDDE